MTLPPQQRPNRILMMSVGRLVEGRPVTKRIFFGALASLTLLASPVTAEPQRLAQGYAPGVLPPYEIMTIVRSTGLRPLDRPLRRGPTYVLHAVGRRGGPELRVVVDARYGDILSVRPVATAWRGPPGLTYGPYERVPPHYVRPPNVYGNAPPDDDELPSSIYGPRPRTTLPPPRVSAAPLPDDPIADPRSDRAIRDPRVIPATPEADLNGPLPPPPERFQRRPPPTAAKPAPKRAAAVETMPPLPKPRPGAKAAPPEVKAAPPDVDASPMPPLLPEQSKSGDEAVPH
jgi:hypothetical protein